MVSEGGLNITLKPEKFHQVHGDLFGASRKFHLRKKGGDDFRQLKKGDEGFFQKKGSEDFFQTERGRRIFCRQLFTKNKKAKKCL